PTPTGSPLDPLIAEATRTVVDQQAMFSRDIKSANGTVANVRFPPIADRGSTLEAIISTLRWVGRSDGAHSPAAVPRSGHQSKSVRDLDAAFSMTLIADHAIDERRAGCLKCKQVCAGAVGLQA